MLYSSPELIDAIRYEKEQEIASLRRHSVRRSRPTYAERRAANLRAWLQAHRPATS